MSAQLFKSLRALKSSGKESFEDLIRVLLENVTGVRFVLATSGTQRGRDLRSESPGSLAIAVECKRYGKKTSLSNDELVGKLSRATHNLLDLDLWVLVASTSVGEQLRAELSVEAASRGVAVEVVTSEDGNPSTLEVLCAFGKTIALERLSEFADSEKLKDELDRISGNPRFDELREELRERLSSPLIGFEAWRASQNLGLRRQLAAERLSRSSFGQPLHVLAPDGLVERRDAWQAMETWLDSWPQHRKPAVVVGEEGDGKTWALVSWLAQKLDRDATPAVVFAPSGRVVTTDPRSLLLELVAGRVDSQTGSRWPRKLERWLSTPSASPGAAPRFVLVLDGLNERNSSGFWIELLQQLLWSEVASEAEPLQFQGFPADAGLAEGFAGQQIAIVVTCRTAYWRRYLAPQKIAEDFQQIRVAPYSDQELDEAFNLHEMSRPDIPRDVLELVRRPRFFDLAVRHWRALGEAGDVTVARLLYEEGRDRAVRKASNALTHEEFQDFLTELATRHLEHERLLTKQIGDLLPERADKNNLIEELRTGGILIGEGNRLRVSESRVPLALGLLLAEQLKEAPAELPSELAEFIESWIGGIEAEQVVEICETAVMHALKASGFSIAKRIALLRAWVERQNRGSDFDRRFSAYLHDGPDVYMLLAETVAEEGGLPWAEDALFAAFRRARTSPTSRELIDARIRDWLGLVHVAGYRLQRGNQGEKEEQVRRAVQERAEQDLQPGPFEYHGYRLRMVDRDGMLRLRRLALGLVSLAPRIEWVADLARACIAEAVMGFPRDFDLLQWVLRGAREDLRGVVEAEARRLIDVGTTAAKRAAFYFLSFDGSERSAALLAELPDDLFPHSPIREHHDADPCDSPYQWSRENLDECLAREDRSGRQLRDNLAHWSADPSVRIPEHVGDQLRALAAELVDSDNWADMDFDHEFDRLEACLCRADSGAWAELIDRMARGVSGKNDTALQRVAMELRARYPMLKPHRLSEIRTTWKALIEDGLSDDARYAELFLVTCLLPDLAPQDQLRSLLFRPDECIDALLLQPSFLPLAERAEILRFLADAESDKDLGRVLWFLSVNAHKLPGDLIPLFAEYVEHEDTTVRMCALRILCDSDASQAREAVREVNWSWSRECNDMEGHVGSVLLAQKALDLEYEELSQRIDPDHLGFAVECRGLLPQEVKRLGRDIDRVWRTVGRGEPEARPGLPPGEVVIESDSGSPQVQRIGVADEAFVDTVWFTNRDLVWGRLDNPDLEHLRRHFEGTSDSERQQLLDQLVEARETQRHIGNSWFGRRLNKNGLKEVLSASPELAESWLEPLVKAEARGSELIFWARGFYETLCGCLLDTQPEQGVFLYWKLVNSPGPAVTVNLEGLRLLDLDLFSASPSDEICAAWDERLEQCKTNKELLELCIASERGTAVSWLDERCAQGIHSDQLFERARAMALLGFSARAETGEVLRDNTPLDESSWIGKVAREALEHHVKGQWAKHWLSVFSDAEDDVEACAAYRVLLRCVDRRLGTWSLGDEAPRRRKIFFQVNRDSLRNAMKKNERPLEDRFVGMRILRRQAHPWLD